MSIPRGLETSPMHAPAHRTCLPTLLICLAALALTPGCDRQKDATKQSANAAAESTSARSDAPVTDSGAPKAPPAKSPSGVSLTFERAPLKLFEKDKLALSIDAEGKVTNGSGKAMGAFGPDGIYTNSKGEFGMQYMQDGTLLRNDKTPFWGRLNADGNYVQKSNTWTFGPDGTFLINGISMGDMRVEGVTPKTYAFAMAVMVAVIHPAAEAVVY